MRVADAQLSVVACELVAVPLSALDVPKPEAAAAEAWQDRTICKLQTMKFAKTGIVKRSSAIPLGSPCKEGAHAKGLPWSLKEALNGIVGHSTAL